MAEPQYIILPVQGQTGQQLHVGSAVKMSGTNQFPEGRPDTERGGEKVAGQSSLIKQVTTDPSILYSFINWEKPGKTLGSFITVMSLIISTRYFSPVQWILKVLCIILGATSLIGIIGRAITKDGITTRVRPREYYRPSGRTYSRLFSEVQEAVDMTLVKLQTIIFAENLQDTGTGFVLSFVAYWLVKTIPPFWLAIITTLLTYSLGAILTRQSSEPSNVTSFKPVLDQKAQDLKNRAVDTASSATNRVANTTQDLATRAMDTASSTTNGTAATAQDIKDSAMNTAAYNTDRAAGTVQELKNRTTERSHSATNGTGYPAHGTGAEAVGDYRIAAPNVPGLDRDGLSYDRRTQLHPLESGV